MGVTWTREQQQVIDLRERNILVSAAAGSGKTAVLVERIIKRITEGEHPVDIDRLLIVTFTNAAAAEMRERISAAIEKALMEQPENEHLQRQLTLIHNAQITTIDSFCLYVIRNHFHEIDLEPNFRIGDEGELKLMREDVLKEVLLLNYEECRPEFTAFMEGYAAGRSDAKAGEMILALYEFSRSYPWPKEWLHDCVRGYEPADEKELLEAEWMKPLVANVRAVFADLVRQMEQALSLARADDGPYMYENVLENDKEKYESLAACEDYLQFYEAIKTLTYDRLPSSRGFDGDADKLSRAKELRDGAKKLVKKLGEQYFYCAPEQMAEALRKTAPYAKELVRLTEAFSDAFAAEKRRRNLVDFHDLEHFALDILVDEETKQPRKAAEEFRDTYAEIMIDEYQDSNHVQETILRTISTEERGENNIFMVGDVKQSIYRFRLARPELFMEKYDTYSTEESAKQRIDLHKNFRSRNEVLSCTNDIFYKIMARDLGNVAYDSEAALYPGAVYPDAPEGMFAPEILLVDSNDELLSDADASDAGDKKQGVNTAGGAGIDSGDKKLLEAKMVAERIRRMIKEQQVTDKETGELRNVRYSDIVILLRSLNGWADAFAAVLNDAGIPAHTLLATGYFSAVEVQTVLAMLRILDNPRQDIPLAAVLRSPIVGMTDEELAMVRLFDREESFCGCVLKKCEELCGEEASGEGAEKSTDAEEGPEKMMGSPEAVKKSVASPESAEKSRGLRELCGYEKKLYDFYTMYKKLRKLVPDTPIHELIEILLQETGYGSYAAAMPAGNRRRANLQMLVEKAIAFEKTSYKGLFHFVRYIDELQKYDVDFGEADMTSENEDVVRIMSIHKSKGLEFPVVFVCGLGKRFNRQDVRSRMVLHPELGMGIDCMDGAKRLKSPTIAKRAIAKQIDLENLGEELRVLYVALTRAKEKLILTGARKDAAEELARLRGEVCGGSGASETKDTPLPYTVREGAAGYLDWLLPAVVSYGERYPVQIITAAGLVAEEIETQAADVLDEALCLDAAEHANPALVRNLNARFSFRYPYGSGLEQKNKYSVSELKHRAMREYMEREEEETASAFLQEEIVPYVPAFVRRMEQGEEKINQGALRGTAVHRVMECYDFASGRSAAEQVEQMVADGKLSEEMRKLVKLSLVENFLQSDIGARMRAAEQAGCLYREKAFVMGFTPEELAAFGFGEMQKNAGMSCVQENADGMRGNPGEVKSPDGEDLTLIQGIIDVFWIEEDGIVVLDYKTDRVDTAEQLKNRYAAQLKLYGEALERIFNKGNGTKLRVKECLLYSFRLGEVIAV
ncbi:MAG: helicase-exonuclease AddAB subunit AddA [Roseburia sp.]|nr:helicase-exonuclease AddAB subunit AddA [Roseburia sp.]